MGNITKITEVNSPLFTKEQIAKLTKAEITAAINKKVEESMEDYWAKVLANRPLGNEETLDCTAKHYAEWHIEQWKLGNTVASPDHPWWEASHTQSDKGIENCSEASATMFLSALIAMHTANGGHELEPIFYKEVIKEGVKILVQ